VAFTMTNTTSPFLSLRSLTERVVMTHLRRGRICREPVFRCFAMLLMVLRLSHLRFALNVERGIETHR